MLSKKMQKALNDQINKEMYSSYLYLSMAAGFKDKNLNGCANWVRVQSQEEMGHAMKIFSYIYDRAGSVKLAAIAAPPTEFDTPLSVFEMIYEHEQKVTGMIDKLMDLAIEEKDYATQSFLKWLIDEQVEEEDSALAVVNQLKMIGDSVNGLFMLDHALGARGSK